VPILVLDETVSSLDVETKQALQSALQAARPGRTALVTAHRLTIRAADWIVLLERGRVVEQGIFNELVAANGAFARLTAGGATAPPDTAASAPLA
jgi:ABC-type multidrug transport system fused ATPase/permease subunit